MRPSKRGVAWVVATFIALQVAAPSRADILFRGTDPIAIGKGTQQGGKIHWTNCEGENSATFKKPPYYLDKANNCSVGPPVFGLECEGSECKVTDEVKLRKYLPGAQNGDRVTLRIDSKSVELSSSASHVKLKR